MQTSKFKSQSTIWKMNSLAQYEEVQARTRAMLEQESSRYSLAGSSLRISDLVREDGQVNFVGRREDPGLAVTPDFVFRNWILELTKWAYNVVDHLGKSNVMRNDDA